MPHPENLIPAQKGEVRNPKGRGNSVNYKTILQRIGNVIITRENPISEQEETLTAQEHLMFVLFARGLNGDIKAITEILDRVEGKATQTVNADVNTHSSDPLQIVITSDVRLTRDTEDDEPNTSAPAIPSELHSEEEVGS